MVTVVAPGKQTLYLVLLTHQYFIVNKTVCGTDFTALYGTDK